MKDQRRRLDGAKDLAHIDLHQRLPEQPRHRRARAGPLGTTEHGIDTLDLGERAEEDVDQCALAPVLVDLAEDRNGVGFGEAPRMLWQIAEKRAPVPYTTIDRTRSG